MKTKLVIGLIIVGVILIGGVIYLVIQPSPPQSIKQRCIQACEQALAQGKDLTNGPCLLDPMENSDWVCDVAHRPRQPVDNLRENQCNAWHNGIAKHFVEVTPDCEFIRAG